MDSCLGVEVDLDKALSKFADLNENTNKVLEDIIAQVEELQTEISKQPEDAPLMHLQAIAAMDMAAMVKQTVFQMSTEHRELHATVSRVGKSIDRHFVVDYASVAPKAESFCSDTNRPIMEQAIAQHLYRQGLEDVGDALVSEARIPPVERTCTFAQLQRCAAALAAGEPAAALQWAESRAQELLHSPLPFTLHRMQALKLGRERGVRAAIEYARAVFPAHAARHERQLQAAVCALAWCTPRAPPAPPHYRHLLDLRALGTYRQYRPRTSGSCRPPCARWPGARRARRPRRRTTATCWTSARSVRTASTGRARAAAAGRRVRAGLVHAARAARAAALPPPAGPPRARYVPPVPAAHERQLQAAVCALAWCTPRAPPAPPHYRHLLDLRALGTYRQYRPRTSGSCRPPCARWPGARRARRPRRRTTATCWTSARSVRTASTGRARAAAAGRRVRAGLVHAARAARAAALPPPAGPPRARYVPPVPAAHERQLQAAVCALAWCTPRAPPAPPHYRHLLDLRALGTYRQYRPRTSGSCRPPCARWPGARRARRPRRRTTATCWTSARSVRTASTGRARAAAAGRRVRAGLVHAARAARAAALPPPAGPPRARYVPPVPAAHERQLQAAVCALAWCTPRAPPAPPHYRHLLDLRALGTYRQYRPRTSGSCRPPCARWPGARRARRPRRRTTATCWTSARSVRTASTGRARAAAAGRRVRAGLVHAARAARAAALPPPAGPPRARYVPPVPAAHERQLQAAVCALAWCTPRAPPAPPHYRHLLDLRALGTYRQYRPRTSGSCRPPCARWPGARRARRPRRRTTATCWTSARSVRTASTGRARAAAAGRRVRAGLVHAARAARAAALPPPAGPPRARYVPPVPAAHERQLQAAVCALAWCTPRAPPAPPHYRHLLDLRALGTYRQYRPRTSGSCRPPCARWPGARRARRPRRRTTATCWTSARSVRTASTGRARAAAAGRRVRAGLVHAARAARAAALPPPAGPPRARYVPPVPAAHERQLQAAVCALAWCTPRAPPAPPHYRHLLDLRALGTYRQYRPRTSGSCRPPCARWPGARRARRPRRRTTATCWTSARSVRTASTGRARAAAAGRRVRAGLVHAARAARAAALPPPAGPPRARYVPPVPAAHERQLQAAVCALAWCTPRAPPAPPHYRHLLDLRALGAEAAEVFVREACALLRLAPLSPLAGAVVAGARVLPALHDIRAKMSHPHVIAAWSDDELPLEVDLGEDGGGYHSVFACPILRQQASEHNPPMRLLCGHVISRDALNKLAMGVKLKCPYCPMEQSPSEARQIYFS
ncbi:uncharacterized protein Sou [Epargyreus clarus]|uniref:uncharacterized protein Sou n=1 Tax=Epargyreus clarus TaxID=520877 RepID=UPI003C2AC587